MAITFVQATNIIEKLKYILHLIFPKIEYYYADINLVLWIINEQSWKNTQK